jgi:hypothetical protein
VSLAQGTAKTRTKFDVGSRLVSWPAFAVLIVTAQAIFSAICAPGLLLSSFTLITSLVLHLIATAVAIRNALQSVLGQRRFWGFLALGFAAWTWESLSWVYYELFLHQSIPDESIANVALLFYVVAFMGATGSRPYLGVSSKAAKMAERTFLGELIFWTIVTIVVLSPRFSEPKPAALTFNVRFDALYFAEYLVLMAMLLAAIHFAPKPWRMLYWNFFGVVSVFAFVSLIADLGFDIGGYYPGDWTDLVSIGALCWFIWILLFARRLRRDRLETIVVNS